MAGTDTITDDVSVQLHEAQRQVGLLAAAVPALLRRINETWERWDALEAENEFLTRQLKEANEALRLEKAKSA